LVSGVYRLTKRNSDSCGAYVCCGFCALTRKMALISNNKRGFQP